MEPPFLVFSLVYHLLLSFTPFFSSFSPSLLLSLSHVF